MDINNYTDQEVIDELTKAMEERAKWSTGDKRTRRVKYELNFADAIIARDTHELLNRGLTICLSASKKGN